jgi:hypothetical protein
MLACQWPGMATYDQWVVAWNVNRGFSKSDLKNFFAIATRIPPMMPPTNQNHPAEISMRSTSLNILPNDDPKSIS